MFDINHSRFYPVPVQLINPDIVPMAIDVPEPQSFLSRYSTNSGTAFGLTTNEALLHSVNELVERDALSDLYYSIAFNADHNFMLLGTLYDEIFSQLVSKDLKSIVSDAWIVSRVEDNGIVFCSVVENWRQSIPNGKSCIRCVYLNAARS